MQKGNLFLVICIFVSIMLASLMVGCKNDAVGKEAVQPETAAATIAPSPTAGKGDSTVIKGSMVGNLLPTLQLSGFDGREITLPATGDNKITVINFWATWCPPCREEMPELNAYYQENKDKIVFYAVNLQESADKVSKFMNDNNYMLPVLLDQEGVSTKLLQIRGIPTTFIIDQRGIIQFRKSGTVSKNELAAAVSKL